MESMMRIAERSYSQTKSGASASVFYISSIDWHGAMEIGILVKIVIKVDRYMIHIEEVVVV